MQRETAAHDSADWTPPWTTALFIAVATGIAYFFAARLGLELLTRPDGVAVFWPAAGISAGALICLGPGVRLPVIVGVVGATIGANLLGDRNVWSSIVFAGCNAGEAVLVAALLHRFFGSPFSLDSFQRVMGLFAAASIATAVSGIGGTAGYWAFHPSKAPSPLIWYHWFASDAIGIIAVAPILIGVLAAIHDPPPRRELFEGLLAIMTVAALSFLTINVPHHPGLIEVNDFGVLFVPLLWIASRCRPVFAAAAALVVNCAIVWATTFGIGIFGDTTIPIDERILTAQIATTAFSLCAFVLAALFAERRLNVAALQEQKAQLGVALEAAKLANRTKSHFLAATSHDLRQPLQTFESSLGILERQPQNKEGRKVLATMAHSLQTMTTMLNTLLDINQLETGNLRTSLTTFPINEVFDALASDFQKASTERGVAWRLVRSRLWVSSDRRLLEEMIRNLLSNAIRCSDRGKIVMGCRRAGERVSIEVWDSGVGIAGDQIPRIFEEHHRAGQTGHHDGFGLGLSIVRRLGQILGHRVDVRSTPGKGSSFCIEVPLAPDTGRVVDQLELNIDASAPIDGAILLVEDDGAVRKSLDLLLRTLGHKVVSVATGNDALALVAGKQVRPVLIICDYNLPGEMDGIKAIDALRDALSEKVPGIILTGDARPDLRKNVASHDIGLGIKPLKADDLQKLLVRTYRGSNISVT